MLSGIKEAVELKWDAPYRFATSVLALLLIGSWWQRPLLTASWLLDWANADAWANGVRVADTWMLTHVIPGSPVLVVIVLLGAVPATVQGSVVPTRAAGTFWVVIALAIYVGASPAAVIVAAALGAFMRMLFTKVNTGEDFWDTGSQVLVNVVFAALWAPGILTLWAFAKSD